MSTELTVVYPPDCESDPEREEHLAHLYEALRRHHNERGDDYEAGLITEGEWRAFLADFHRPRSHAVAAAEAALTARRREAAGLLPDGAPELAVDLNAAFEPEVN